MVADCPANCARWILCLANFVFIVVSAAVLAVGIWVAADKTSFIKLTLNVTHLTNTTDGENSDELLKSFVEPTVIENAAYILIAIGAFIFIISFLGYCGSIKESRVLLTSYGIFLIIIFILEIALVVMVTAFRESHIDNEVKKYLHHTLNAYYDGGEDKNALALGWDEIMTNLHCCGVEGWEDLKKAKRFVQYASAEGLGRQLPESCCVLNETTGAPVDPECIKIGMNENYNQSYANIGCYDMFHDAIKMELTIVIGVAVALAAVELLAMIFAFCLCRAAGKEQDYHHYKY